MKESKGLSTACQGALTPLSRPEGDPELCWAVEGVLHGAPQLSPVKQINTPKHFQYSSVAEPSLFLEHFE